MALLAGFCENQEDPVVFLSELRPIKRVGGRIQHRVLRHIMQISCLDTPSDRLIDLRRVGQSNIRGADIPGFDKLCQLIRRSPLALIECL